MRRGGMGSRMRIAAILVAAGTGSRFGADTPKQFLILGGMPVMRRAALALLDHVQWLQPVGEAAPIVGGTGRPRAPAAGPGGRHPAGERRRRTGGVDPVRPRPRADPRCRAPADPRPARSRRSSPPWSTPRARSPPCPSPTRSSAPSEGRITETVPRAGLFRAQTPQGFRFPILLALHRNQTGNRGHRRRRATREGRRGRAAGAGRRGQHKVDLSGGYGAT